MARKSFVQQAKDSLDRGIEHLSFARYQLACQRFQKVIEICKPLHERGCFSGSRPYGCYIISSAFGQGLAEGLMEYLSQDVKTLEYFSNASRILYQSARAFQMSDARVLEQETHTKIGKGYGLLGLKKEGLEILKKSRKINIFSCYGVQ